MGHSQKLFSELPVPPGPAKWYRWTAKLPHRERLRATVSACLLGLCTQSCVWMEVVSVNDNGDAVGVAEERSAISLDGRFIAFVTDAALLPIDNNGLADVYRRDMATANVTLVSVNTLGGGADAPSGEPDISDDGDRVAFSSTATDLGPTANGQSQVYVRTLSTVTTVLASADVSAGDGASTAPSMARDGSAVAFASEATNLSPGDTNGVSDIFRYEITGALVTLRSVGLGGSNANGASFDPASNADGSVIAFTSESSNLVTGDNNGVADIFTVSDAAIVRISQGLLGEANGPSGEPAIADDTNAVVFSSDAGNLVADDNNGVTDVFFSPPGGPVERLSQNGAFGYSLPSTAPSVSANGTRVAFITDGVNIDHPAGTTAVITDRVEGRVDALATVENSQPAVPASDVSLSPDGAIASFSSTASLDGFDTNAAPDIYTRFTYPAYIWEWSLAPGTVAPGSVTPVTLSGYGFVVGGPLPVITVSAVPGITFTDVVVVDAGTITAVMTVPASAASDTYSLQMETPGNRADMLFGRARLCPCLTVVDPLPPGDLNDIGAEVGISGPDGPTTNVSVDDFNGDSFADILFLRHGATSIQLLGDGAVGVEPVEIMPLAQADRHECDSADVNNDGLIDIYCSVGASVGEGMGNNSLWLGQPDGGYTDVAQAWGVTDPYGRGRYVTFLHANYDGLPDLFVTNLFPRSDEHVSENHLFINDGGTGFIPAPEFGVDGPIGSRCAVTTDFDNDGDDDLVVCGSDRVRMYSNEGGTGFVDVALANGFGQLFFGAAFADIDDDGDVDVAFSTATQFAIHRMQNGVDAGQVFSDTATNGHNVAFGEINGDGIPDAYFVQRGCRTEAEGNLPDIVAVSKGAGWVVKHPPALNRGCGDAVVAFDHDGDGVDGFVVGNGRGRDGPLQYIVAPPPGC
ncbi:MAG: Tol biopolymer transport system component [Halioglobus sp.]|jgi:Tol biopolymer transport system component